MTIWEQRKEKMRATLIEKAKEYAANGDRLHNFRRAAEIHGCTIVEACMGMALKHIVSVIDILEGNQNYCDECIGECKRRTMIDEKVGDALNYCVLMNACAISKHDIFPFDLFETIFDSFTDMVGEQIARLSQFMELNKEVQNVVQKIIDSWQWLKTDSTQGLTLAVSLMLAEYQLISELPNE